MSHDVDPAMATACRVPTARTLLGLLSCATGRVAGVNVGWSTHDGAWFWVGERTDKKGRRDMRAGKSVDLSVLAGDVRTWVGEDDWKSACEPPLGASIDDDDTGVVP